MRKLIVLKLEEFDILDNQAIKPTGEVVRITKEFCFMQGQFDDFATHLAKIEVADELLKRLRKDAITI